MFFETHHRMGQLLHDRLARRYPGRVNRDAFVYGNVKPDLMRKGAKDRHMLSDTASFINLTAGFLQLPSMEPEEDWVQLGMICHHICDSFCRYHQELLLYRDYPRHLEYELGLNSFFIGWQQNGLMVNADGRVIDVAHPEGFTLPEADDEVTMAGMAALSGVTRLLQPQLARYRAGSPSFFLDIFFAMESCCIVTDTILETRFQKGSSAHLGAPAAKTD